MVGGAPGTGSAPGARNVGVINSATETRNAARKCTATSTNARRTISADGTSYLEVAARSGRELKADVRQQHSRSRRHQGDLPSSRRERRHLPAEGGVLH